MSINDKQDHFQVRPRFKVETQVSVSNICARAKERLSTSDCAFSGKVRSNYISIYPKAEDQHYWSPHLSMTIEQDESTGSTVISGLYGPSPSVWLMFIFFYAIIALTFVIVAVIGFANRSIGMSDQILWLLPVLIIIFASLYAVSYFGQKLGHDQIEDIHHFVEEIVESKI